MPPTTPVFDRLPTPKQQLILSSAAAEFSRSGFTAAKVDAIAARAGISVGSLYQYFGTKENCFLAVLEAGIAELQARLEEVLAQVKGPWQRIEAIVRLIPEHSRQHAQVIRLYYEIGGEGLSELGGDFCRRFEGLSAEVYTALMAEARASGVFRSDLDERSAAFCFDSLLMAFQFSFASDYHRVRKDVYLGPVDDEALVQQVLNFLRWGLAGAPASLGATHV